MKKIILCSTQRSGSTMVVEDFRNSGIMGNPDEYFIPWQGFKEGIDIDKEIDSLFLKGTKHDVFSVKIMANQIQKVNFLLKNYSSRCNNILELFHDAYWIYIKRDDIVEQAISRYIAIKTNAWHAVANKNDKHFVGHLIRENIDKYNYGVEYDFNHIMKHIINIKDENLFWLNFFKQNNIHPLILTYEIYSKDLNFGYLNDVANYINVDYVNKVLGRKIVKLANIINENFKTLLLKDLNVDKTIQDKDNLLSFQTQYGTAKSRIQNHLSYKLGQAMIVNSKSFLGYLIMPMALLSIMISHKQEQKIYQEKIKKNPSLKLPPLESYPDYKEALKFKNHLSYKLGEALIKASNNWYGGGYIKLWFEIGKLKREFRKKDNHA
ncbi:hypothetical protein B7M67_08635 [Campylobacter coli]|nr:hypothetical protein [Campylobacter coli]EAL1303617.1 hypothetical protein [Campylobacter coli]